MRTQLTQAQGGTLRAATLMAIARSSNCKVSEVAYFDAGISIDDIKFLFDKDSESVWVNEGTGTVVSWTLSDEAMTVITNTGTYTLNKEVDGTTGSIKWIYNGGYAKGGETTVTIDADSALSVTEAYLNGGRQFEGQGYTASGLTVTLASPLSRNDLLVIILGSETLDSADALQSVLAGSGGAGTIGASNGGAVSDYIDYIVLTAFGSPNGSDYTNLFIKAYATGKAVYVPDGTYFTTVFNPKQTFGPGKIFSNFSSDNLYADNGQRPINPFNNFSTDPVFFYTNSTGNYERGAGLSVLFNMDDSRPQVMGFNTDSTQGTYTNRDAVGVYIGSRGPSNQPLASNCTFTTTTFTSTDITEDFLSTVKLGMFCITITGSYSGRIVAVDSKTNTITVSGWYSAGNTTSGQIPPAGSSVRINDVSKIWGQNTVLFIDYSKSGASTGTGYELGFQLSSQPSLLWGFDSVNYSASYTGTRAHLARGLWSVGYYSAGTVSNGFFHEITTDNNTTVPFIAQNLTNPNYTGSILRYNTNYRNDNSKLIDITSGGTANWFLTTNGNRSSIRELYQVISSSMTLNKLSNSTILCTNTTAITLTADATSVPTSMQFEISAIGSAGVTLTTSTGTTTKVIAPGQSIKVLFDGKNFNVLYFSDNRSIGINTVTAATNTINAGTLKRTRYVGNVDTTINFDSTLMVEGQEFEVMNHSTSNTMTVVLDDNTSKTISAGGFGKFIYFTTGIYQLL